MREGARRFDGVSNCPQQEMGGCGSRHAGAGGGGPPAPGAVPYGLGAGHKNCSTTAQSITGRQHGSTTSGAAEEWSEAEGDDDGCGPAGKKALAKGKASGKPDDDDVVEVRAGSLGCLWQTMCIRLLLRLWLACLQLSASQSCHVRMVPCRECVQQGA